MTKPTDEQIKEFIEMFKDQLPSDPTQYPRKMEYYWKLYLFNKGLL